MEALCQWFYVKNMLLYTHTCPVTEFAVASHLNTANSCCHHVFLRHFWFQKCLPVNSNGILPMHSASKTLVCKLHFRCINAVSEEEMLEVHALTTAWRITGEAPATLPGAAAPCEGVSSKKESPSPQPASESPQRTPQASADFSQDCAKMPSP